MGSKKRLRVVVPLLGTNECLARVVAKAGAKGLSSDEHFAPHVAQNLGRHDGGVIDERRRGALALVSTRNGRVQLLAGGPSALQEF